MPVYINYSDFQWNNQNYVQLAFSGNKNYHDVHYINKQEFELVKLLITLIKQQIPSSQRNYEPTEKIWMIPAIKRAEYEALFASTHNYTWNKVPSLLDYIITSKRDYDQSISSAHRQREFEYMKQQGIKAESAEDFYHQFKEPQVKISSMSIDDVMSKLINLYPDGNQLFITSKDSKLAKKFYLRAALALHPDRNNGDGSKMSELNMLWQEYVKLCPEMK